MTTLSITVDFPLRGEWTAYHTPAERVPSHGVDQLGQRYAYDFVRIDRNREGWHFSAAPAWRRYITGVPLDQHDAWGAPIHAPFAGTVVASLDGWPERRPVHFLRDLGVVLRNALTFDPAGAHGLTPVLGNHIILRMPEQDVYALIAHARTGSLRVRPGDDVQRGQHLADVGHSGNSTAPHLHFQLMDSADLLTASGLPCSFQQYEALRDGTWVNVQKGMPGKREFVRYTAPA
jgi:murein DD-endopeptidase MepM/ murein hydrolase activator NlpD